METFPPASKAVSRLSESWYTRFLTYTVQTVKQSLHTVQYSSVYQTGIEPTKYIFSRRAVLRPTRNLQNKQSNLT